MSEVETEMTDEPKNERERLIETAGFWICEGNRQHIAHHEASHAVVAIRLGFKVWWVTIKGIKSSKGCAKILMFGKPTDQIIINLAGIIGEELIDPTTSFSYRCKNGGQGDWRSACKLAWQLDAPPSSIIDECKAKTRALVQQNQQAIADVAAALLKRETLTGDEVKRLIGRSPERRA